MSTVKIQSNEELIEVSPAQAFDTHKGLAIVTVPFVQNRSEQKKTYFFITSNRKTLEATESSLLQLGYTSDRFPRPKQRWSSRSLDGFIKGKSLGSLAGAYRTILEQLETHIDLGAYENVEALALWIIGTYLYRLFPAYPYIHLNGMAEAGKTKTLYLVSLMAFNACMGAETTPAALIRLTHDNQSTLCLDEVEKLHNAKDEASKTVLAILNVGYKRGAAVQKMQAGKNGKDWDLKEFDPYSPKILAGIRGFASTLATRCISILLMKSENPEIVNREVDSDDPIWQKIRDSIYEGVMSGEWLAIKNVYAPLEDTELKGRNWETWKPLLSIAKHLENNYPDLYMRLRAFSIEHSKHKRGIIDEADYCVKIALGLSSYFLKEAKQQESFIPLRKLLDYLVMFDEESFMDPQSKTIYRWMSTRWLASELRQLGIVQGAAQQGKVSGKNVKGYWINYTNLKRRMKTLGVDVDSST